MALRGSGLRFGLWREGGHRLLEREHARTLVLSRDVDLLGLADRLHAPSIGAIAGVRYPSSAASSTVTVTSVATATARYSGQWLR
jgi:hypothetical protein